MTAKKCLLELAKSRTRFMSPSAILMMEVSASAGRSVNLGFFSDIIDSCESSSDDRLGPAAVAFICLVSAMSNRKGAKDC